MGSLLTALEQTGTAPALLLESDLLYHPGFLAEAGSLTAAEERLRELGFAGEADGNVIVPVRIPAIITLLENISRGIVSGGLLGLARAIEIDRRRGRYHNPDLAEDIIPVNADIEEARVILKRRPR
jgi:hypothetical protein